MVKMGGSGLPPLALGRRDWPDPIAHSGAALGSPGVLSSPPPQWACVGATGVVRHPCDQPRPVWSQGGAGREPELTLAAGPWEDLQGPWAVVGSASKIQNAGCGLGTTTSPPPPTVHGEARRLRPDLGHRSFNLETTRPFPGFWLLQRWGLLFPGQQSVWLPQ